MKRVQSLPFRRGLLVWFRLSFLDRSQLQKALRCAWRCWRCQLRFYWSLRHFCSWSLSSFCLLDEQHIWVAWCRWCCFRFPNSFPLHYVLNSRLFILSCLELRNLNLITIHFVQPRVIACAYHSLDYSLIICYFCFVYIESQSSLLAAGSIAAAAFTWCAAIRSA